MQRITIKEKSFDNLGDLVNEFLEDRTLRGLTKTTVDGYKSFLKVHLDFNQSINDVDFNSLYREVIENDKLRVNSKASYLRNYKVFVRWLNDKGYSFPLPSLPREDVIKDTYSDDDLKKLLKRPKDATFVNYRDWMMVSLFIETGMRLSTLINIKVEDVDLEKRVIVTTHNKNHKYQLIPFGKTYASNLKKYLQVVPKTEYLFTNIYGEQLTKGGIESAIGKYNRKRGVTLTSIHAFRHTFARKFLLDLDGDVFTLQKLLGHSTLAMTSKYARIYDGDLLDVYQFTSPIELLSKSKIKL